MKEKIHFLDIDICKGIAMLGILLMHSFIVFPINIHDQAWSLLCLNVVCSFPLQLFFVMSGYLSANSKERTFSESLVVKSKRLLLPYLTYSIITICLKYAFPSIVNKHYDSIWAYLLKFFLYGGELWFLYVLFSVFMVWPYIIKKKNTFFRGGVVIVLFILYLAANYQFAGDVCGVFCFKYFLWYSIFFILGYLTTGINRGVVFNKRFTILYFFMFLLFDVVLIQIIPHKMSGFILLTSIVGCLFIWSLSVNMKYGIMSRGLSFIGRQSLAYYFLNGFVLVLVRTTLINVLHVKNEYIIVIMILIGCLFVESIMILALKKIPYSDLFVGVIKK